MELFANNAQSTLVAGINAAVLACTVASAAAFPVSGTFRIKIGNEIIKVTAVAGAVFTIERGTEGTTAAAHSAGATVTAIITAEALELLKEDVQIRSAYFGIGAIQSTVGSIRLAAAGGSIYGRDAGDTADCRVIEWSAGSDVNVGDATRNQNIFAYQWDTNIQGTASLYLTNLAVNACLPVLGDDRVSSPYGNDGTTSIDMLNANFTLLAADYRCKFIKAFSTPNFTAARTLLFPAPVGANAEYCKFVSNAQGGAFGCVCSVGAGTTVSIASARGAWVKFTASGCVRMSADSVV